ncbi:hypothetical protein ScPMuIL_003475, partial [Solemya velum]
MSDRGPIAVLISYLMVIISCGLHLRTVIHQRVDSYLYRSTVGESCTYCTTSLILLLLLTLIPQKSRTSRIDLSIRNVNSSTSEEEPLSRTLASTYGTLQDIHEEAVTAEKNTSWFSKLIFYWVNPLMVKGARRKIHTAEDLFLLPERLDTSAVEKGFEVILHRNKQIANTVKNHQHQNVPEVAIISKTSNKARRTLLRSLNQAYGLEYYSLGVLKLLADCFGFAAPILLNLLVSFMESRDETESHGYLYAVGLLFVTLFGSLCSAHFDYNIKVVGFKIRAAIIQSTVYRKALSVSHVSATKFTSGEIVNFMSTDTDRIVNFCPSFHAFWSLPFQIGVSLYLLYLQVGLAFLAGLGFAIVLVPVNKWLAQKIGSLSSAMMGQKDERVKVMSEILYGMRVVKFYALEDHFKSKVEEIRELELKNLKGRKYLDAMCVYFWATTPVLISILTFTTYSLMGNQLTAAKV